MTGGDLLVAQSPMMPKNGFGGLTFFTTVARMATKFFFTELQYLRHNKNKRNVNKHVRSVVLAISHLC